ncbi:MAG: hypothetical protein PHF44_04555, partial [Candidatus Pacebacteria bacterium]|nr:hypothetical protein [Candidatus Paceibacterota bacterium]
CAPTLVFNKTKCLHANLGNLRMCCVRHVHILHQGGAKVLNHDITIDKCNKNLYSRGERKKEYF